MKPEDPIFSNNYERDFLGEEEFRAREKRVVDNLKNLFAPNNTEQNTEPVVVGNGLEHLGRYIKNLDCLADIYFPGTTSTVMSIPYERFDHNGVILQSRILRLNLHNKFTAYPYGAIYLVGLMGEGQQTATLDNFHIGFVVTNKGQTEFFKVEKSKNFDKLQRRHNSNNLKVTSLSHEDRDIVVSEFEKAINNLDKSAKISDISEFRKH